LGYIKYYAALKEWSTGEHKHQDFTADMNLDVYKGHMTSLDQIEKMKTGSYHRMMGDIYHLAVYVPPSHQFVLLIIISSNTGQSAVPVAALDMGMLELDESD
jgi:hypothetical protein